MDRLDFGLPGAAPRGGGERGLRVAAEGAPGQGRRAAAPAPIAVPRSRSAAARRTTSCPSARPSTARSRPCRRCAWNATPRRPCWSASTPRAWRAGSAATSSRTTLARLGRRPWSAGSRSATRQGLPRRGRGAVPQERARERPLPSARLLSPRQHPKGRGGEAGGSDLRQEAGGPTLALGGEAALRGPRLVREARHCLHARRGPRHLGRLRVDATAHVSPDCLARALEIMERAWPEGEEHMAKLSVNALIGLWARSKDVFYSMRTSNHEVDGRGCQYQQVFLDDRGRSHYDHIYATELFSNRSFNRRTTSSWPRSTWSSPGSTEPCARCPPATSWQWRPW